MIADKKNVSRETSARLADFAALVRKWTPRINLIAPGTVADLETRHIEDSLQLAELAEPQGQDWCDLGSGGGFPGLVVAIATQQRATRVTLIESDRRKSAFLATAIRTLNLQHTQVLTRRIETAPAQNAAIVSARALAPLPKLMAYVHHHLAPGGAAWLMKGARWQEEIAEARNHWRFAVEPHPSRTDPNATILHVTEISPL